MDPGPSWSRIHGVADRTQRARRGGTEHLRACRTEDPEVAAGSAPWLWEGVQPPGRPQALTGAGGEVLA